MPTRLALIWLAVNMADTDRLYEVLSMAPTGEPGDHVDSEISGGRVRGGWHVVQSWNIDDLRLFSRRLPAISKLGETILCSAGVAEVGSYGESWSGGKQRWFVRRDPRKRGSALTTNGELPPEYGAVREEHAKRRTEAGGADADTDVLLEVPVELTRRICGYRPDADDRPWAEPGPYALRHVAAAPSRRTRPWFKFW